MLVWQTSEFKKDIADYALEQRVEELTAKLESTDDPESAGFHTQGDLRPYWRKRYRDKEVRIIAKLVEVGSNLPVMCLLRAIHKQRGGGYDEFWGDPASFELKHLKSPVDPRSLESWAAEQQVKWKKPLLPEGMCGWLLPPQFAADASERTVYESLEWVKRSKRPQIHAYWASYHDLLLDIDDGHPGRKLVRFVDVYLHGKKSRWILYAVPPLSGRAVLYLIAQFDSVPNDDDIALLLNANYSFGAVGAAEPQLEFISRASARSYPYWLLYDEECWRRVQGDDEANLALSPEEENILLQAAKPGFGQGGLPLFINGRAGSGKSTLLLYLFAEFLDRWFANAAELQYAPIFLTYNEHLLAVAKESVHRLLHSHHTYISKSGTNREAPGDLAPFFQAFRQFLLSMLRPDQRTRFAPDSFVSFYRFKRAYLGGSTDTATGDLEPLYLGRNDWSPELCWYIIRTFIKGTSPEAFMDVDGFLDLPSKARGAISSNLFEEIHSRVWSSWYSKQSDRGFWDDQDLVRAVMTSGVELPRFGAIFCDEVQDFTRLELSFLLRLPAVRAFDLSTFRPSCFPLAFAGDPFQTLNPTGFRWASVSQLFQEEIACALDPMKRIGSRLISFEDLKTNYRACSGLVASTNLIQLWRHVFLDAPDLVPQQPWRKDDSPGAQVFMLEEGALSQSQDLAEALAVTVILVPCEEGQEADFIKNDSVLASALSVADSGSLGANVMSAIAAKGLEFDRVILYKFGEHAPNEVIAPNEGSRPDFAKEHFFNKLYVAISRARSHLYVVDSHVGHAKLWRFAMDPQHIAGTVAAAKESSKWRAEVSPFERGNEPRELRETDPLKNANEFRSKGEQFGNPDYLRRAAFYFERAGYEREAHECKAQACTFAGNHIGAGAEYEQLNDLNQAFVCYWGGKCWQQLLRLFEVDPGLASSNNKRRIARRLAAFICSPGLDRLELFSTAEALAKYATEYPSESVNQLQDVALVVADRASQSSLSPSEALVIARALASVAESGDNPDLFSAAAWFFAQGNSHAAACRRWEAAGETSRQEYFFSKAMITSGVEKLGFLERARDYQRIAKEWRSDSTPEELEIICRALLAIGDLANGLRLALKTRQIDQVRRALSELLPDLNSETVSIVTEGIIDLISSGRLDDVVAIEQLATELRHRLPSRLSGDERLRARAARNLHSISDNIRSTILEQIPQRDLSAVSESVREALLRMLTVVLRRGDGMLTPENVASVWEALDHYHEALAIYAREASSSSGARQDVMRTRWLAVKGKELSFLEKVGDRQKLDAATLELANKRFDWGTTDSEARTAVSETKWQFVRFPSGTLIVQGDAAGDSRAIIDGYVVVLSPSTRRIIVQISATFDSIALSLDKDDCKGTLTVTTDGVGSSRMITALAGQLRIDLAAVSGNGRATVRLPTGAVIQAQWPLYSIVETKA
jgi:hypothetical protein